MGRTREFDADAVLEVATRTFWRSGYESTSMSELVKRTGVAPKGLYAAYGNKEALFARCVDRYVKMHLAFFDEALDASEEIEVVRRILEGYARLLTKYPEHPGCMALNGALAGSGESERVGRTLAARRTEFEAKLRDRLEAFADDCDHSDRSRAAATACIVMTFVQGLAVQAKSGLSHEEVRATALAFHTLLFPTT